MRIIDLFSSIELSRNKVLLVVVKEKKDIFSKINKSIKIKDAAAALLCSSSSSGGTVNLAVLLNLGAV